MKKGQKVRICDGSYMATIENGQVKDRSENINCIGWNKDTWTVIVYGGSFPTRNEENFKWNNGKVKQNDTIIQNDRTGEIWYCIASISLEKVQESSIPEYTISELQKIVGHKFKIVE